MIQDSGADESAGVTLKDRLEYALLPNGIRQQEQFLPSSCLESICTEVSVFTELSGYFDKEEAKQATSYICDRRRPAKKIFAILALINRIELIRPFQNAALFDQDLPLTTNIEESKVRSRWVDDQRSVLLTRSLQDIKAIRDFNLKQWCVNIPFFERGVGHLSGDLVLHSDTIIPWESAGHSIITGGYGYVQKVKIHKDHHSFLKLLGKSIKSVSFPGWTAEPPVAKTEALGYTLISNQSTFYTFLKKQPAIHSEFSRLQTLASLGFTADHLEQEKADVPRIDARKNTVHLNMTWMLLEHKAREEFREARKQDALFSGDWNYVQSGENDIEDNFSQRHIEMKRTKTFHRLSRDHLKIGYVKRSRAARKEKARLDQANSSAGSKQFEQIPRLKPSVSQWITKLVNQIRYKNGPTFLGEFLEFIEKEMLHPDRIYVMVWGDWSIDL
ncbi:hypothetical protein FANTH_1754 [Fusarium anthophilum]|uniref:Uncharacterized protein n=1 Tax=Fusarium anthophilum TaxID=48485 RepID=A0A8H5EAZ7_9HYPO|nr:hypothetical protein FANTH_1754 [Fusarium anthophilum]